MKRISIIAATVSGNRGAEAMLETAVGRLRDEHPDTQFAVFSYYPERDGELVTDPLVSVYSSTPAYLVLVLFPWSLVLGVLRLIGVRITRMGPESVRALAGSDALVDLAGVSFIDGREKYLPFNILNILPAILMGVPVAKLSQALGPFKGRWVRLAARILWRCTMVVPRGEVTEQNLVDIAFPKDRIFPAPDIAFLFEPRDALSDEGSIEADEILVRISRVKDEGGTVIGVCPSAVLAAKASAKGEDYAGFLSEMVGDIVRRGHTVLLFPNATRAGSAELRNNDLPVIEQIASRLEGSVADSVIAVGGDMNAAALRRLVSVCTCVVVSGFHAMVGALATSVPVLVMGWSHKYLEVMRQFGQERYVFDYSSGDSEAVLARLDELIARRDEASLEVSDALGDVQSRCREQFLELDRRILW
jgi:colanic acid/amylovoran biosynthesis protein